MNISWTPQLLLTFVIVAFLIYFAYKLTSKIAKVLISFVSLWYFLTFTYPTIQVFFGYLSPSKIQTFSSIFNQIKSLFMNLF